MDYWNFRCRQPRFVLKKHKLDLIEATTCQLIADNGNGTVFQRLDCPARRTPQTPGIHQVTDCGVRLWPDPEAPTAGPAGPLTEATTLGLAERFGSLRLDHRKRHRSGREHQGRPLCSRSTIGS